MADVTMPQLGETVTEGTITKWFKQVGDKVEADEPLFEVSTDKVDSEVPASAGGYLAEILVQEGETVDVGAKLAVISDEAPSEGGGDEAPKDEAAEAEAPEGEQEEPEEKDTGEQPEADASEEPEDGEGGEAAREERAAAEGDEKKEDDKDEPEAKKDSEKEEESEDAGEPDTAPQPPGDGGDGQTAGKVLSPVVRRLISEHDLDPAQIKGTGAGGRITRADVLAVVEGGERKPAAADGETQAERPAAEEKPAAEKDKDKPAAKPAAAPAAKAGERDQTIPFSNIRRRTAEHMVRSKATSAHVLTAVEADYENVDRVRLAAREEFKAKEGFSLTYLPFVSRAVIDAIEEFPHVNASVGDDELIVHGDVNLGIAVDLNFEGLIVPVIRNADGKRLRAIAREIHELADKARSKKLAADDIAGGTFTITNPGPFGTLITSAVINQPQVAILSTDGVKKRPVVVELPDGSDGIAIHPTGMLALTFDHRAFDGAYASAFIRRIKEFLESKEWVQAQL